MSRPARHNSLLICILAVVLLLTACDTRPGGASSPGPVPAGATARLGKGSITSLAAGMNGAAIFVGDRTGVTRYAGDTLIQEWTTATTEPVGATAVTADGQWVLAGLENGDLMLLDGASGVVNSQLPGFDPAVSVVSAAMSPPAAGTDPSFVAAYGNGQLLAGQVGAAGLTPLGRLAPQSSAVSALEFNDDGRILASANRSGLITLYDVATLGRLIELRGHEAGQAVQALDWNPAGDRLASGSRDGQIVVWDMLRLAPLTQLSAPAGAIVGLAYLDGEAHLSAATAAGEVFTWTTESRDLSPQRVELGGDLQGIAWARNGESIFAGLGDGRLLRAQLENGAPLQTKMIERSDHAPTGASVSAIALAPDGRRLLIARGNRAAIWDVEARVETQRLNAHEVSITAVAWSPDGRQVATADRSGTIILHNAADGTAFRRLAGGSQAVTDIAWSPDGTQFAAADSLADQVRIWDAETGDLLRTLTGAGPGLWSFAWSPDGAQLLAGGVDGRLYQYDLSSVSTNPADAFWRHLGWISDVDWAAAGTNVVSGSADNSVILWDLTQGNSTPLSGHSAPVRGVALNPDGSRAVSGALDRQIIVWDTDPRASQDLIARYVGHTDGVTAVAWSADKEFIVSGSEDGTVVLWPVPE